MLRACRLTQAMVMMAAVAVMGACQSPTRPSDSVSVDQFVDAVMTPDPIQARTSTGKTYRITVNDVTETREYPWRATFDVTVVLNGQAASKDVNLEFPVTLTAATFKIEQASGGIRNPPTGGETERYESVIVQSTGNRYGGVDTSNVMTVDVWYDLPSGRREGLLTATLGFRDADGRTFTKVQEALIAP